MDRFITFGVECRNCTFLPRFAGLFFLKEPGSEEELVCMDEVKTKDCISAFELQ